MTLLKDSNSTSLVRLESDSGHLAVGSSMRIYEAICK